MPSLRFPPTGGNKLQPVEDSGLSESPEALAIEHSLQLATGFPHNVIPAKAGIQEKFSGFRVKPGMTGKELDVVSC